VVWL
jgi:hypothetical protein